MKAIVLDLDGTLCDFYNVNGWLPMLQAENAAPYLIAKPLGDYKKLNGLLAAYPKSAIIKSVEISPND